MARLGVRRTPWVMAAERRIVGVAVAVVVVMYGWGMEYGWETPQPSLPMASN